MVLAELTGGVSDGLRGAGYLVRHPRLWIWVLLPAIAAAILLILVISWLMSLLSSPIDSLAQHMPFDWAGSVMKVAATVALVFASIFIFISVASLIAAPFNEMLSESIEEKLTGVPAPRFNLLRFLYDLGVGLLHALRRIIIYLIVMGSLLLLGLIIPVIGSIIAAAGAWIATARFASYDAYDSIWARRRWKYRAKVQYLEINRWRTLGLGAVIAVFMLVPGVNLIGLSIGAAAATLRVVEVELHLARDGRRGPSAADSSGDLASRA